MAAEIIFDGENIVMVKRDKEITKAELVQKIQNLKKHRKDVKSTRDKISAKMQEIQNTITAYEDVLAQAGGS